jgi:hypothetical protein
METFYYFICPARPWLDSGKGEFDTPQAYSAYGGMPKNRDLKRLYNYTNCININ